MVTVGSYRCMYVCDIPLGDYIGSTLSMAFQCVFSLPVSHSLRQATRSELFKYRQPISFLLLLDTFYVHSAVLFARQVDISHVQRPISSLVRLTP